LGLKPAAVSAAPAFFFGWNAADTLGAPACELAAWILHWHSSLYSRRRQPPPREADLACFLSPFFDHHL